MKVVADTEAEVRMAEAWFRMADWSVQGLGGHVCAGCGAEAKTFTVCPVCGGREGFGSGRNYLQRHLVLRVDKAPVANSEGRRSVVHLNLELGDESLVQVTPNLDWRWLGAVDDDGEATTSPVYKGWQVHSWLFEAKEGGGSVQVDDRVEALTVALQHLVDSEAPQLVARRRLKVKKRARPARKPQGGQMTLF